MLCYVVAQHAGASQHVVLICRLSCRLNRLTHRRWYRCHGYALLDYASSYDTTWGDSALRAQWVSALGLLSTEPYQKPGFLSNPNTLGSRLLRLPQLSWVVAWVLFNKPNSLRSSCSTRNGFCEGTLNTLASALYQTGKFWNCSEGCLPNKPMQIPQLCWIVAGGPVE